MKKFFVALVIISIIAISVSFNLVSAKNNSDNSEDIPEKNGTYNVPGRPDLKVRVFIHNAKPAKPGKPAPQPPVLECGLPDPDSSSTVSAAGWYLPASFTYNLNPNNVPALVGSANWQIIADNSFNVWDSEVSQVSVTQGENTNISRKALDGKNIVAWGQASASVLGVTYIWYYSATGEVVEVDTIMNKKFVWTWSEGVSTCAYTDSYDAQNILTHEIGHWFGLDDEYTLEYTNNTMYGYGFKKDAKGDTLTWGDTEGVQAIYQF